MRARPGSDAAMSPGLIGVVAQLTFAGALAWLSLSAGHPSPEPLPRGLAIGLLYAAPAAVGWLGTVGGRRSLLLAAAAADVVGAPLSWSFVTLLFVVPAILFVGEMGRLPNREMGGRSRLGHALAGMAVAGLLVAAGVALLGLTEPLCWIATPGPAGISYQIVPDAAGIPIGDGQSAGCSSAALTLHGIGLATTLALAGLGLGFLVAGGRAALRSRWEPPRPS